MLHGHKHSGLTYWDHIYPADSGAAGAPHRVLVISGSTLGGTDYRRAEVARAVEFKARQYAPSVALTRVPAVDPGTRLRPLYWEEFHMWGDGTGRTFEEIGVTVIGGVTLDETYARIQALFDGHDPDEQVTNAVCQVEDGRTVGGIPAGYPPLPERHRDRSAWFKQLVDWWQSAQSERAQQLHFNHGSRIHTRYEGTTLLERAIRTLEDKPDSSRSVVALLHAEADLVDQRALKFPSFCLAQFLIVRGAGPPRLDCVGYFRKQELRYWWPVNVAELAKLQCLVLDRLRHRPRGLVQGAITTVAASAYAGNSLPQVAVPRIDRALDEKPGELLAIAHALVWPEMPDRGSKLREWDEWLDDLIASERRDPDGPPIATVGLEKVCRLAAELAQHHGADVEPLLRTLKALHTANSGYLKETLEDTATPERYDEWRVTVHDLVRDIRGQLGLRPGGDMADR
jgi:hypothetical protein